MAVLMSIYRAGALVKQCDESCYDGQPGLCTCVCNGFNHGVGKTLAITQTKANFKAWIANYATQNLLTDYSAFMGIDVI